jgi:hypothetical protein
MQRFYFGLLKEHPRNADHLRSVTMLSSSLNQTAQKLRISNSARIDKKSGIYDEKDTKPAADDDKVVSVLFGSGETRF